MSEPVYFGNPVPKSHVSPIFGSESSRGGRGQRHQESFPMQSGTCIFYDGQHWIAGKNCPHGVVEEDEFGEVHSEGWTVQQ